MSPEADHLSPEKKKLASLRTLDIFHPWESLDEKRLCLRCGQIISGREIRVCGGERGHGAVRLECPTEGCPAVPIEWVMLDDPNEPGALEPVAPAPPEVPRTEADGKAPQRSPSRPPLFGFLRVAPFFL